MYTYCTKEDWEDENFDLSWAEQENGTFATREEALRDAEKHGLKAVVLIHED